MQTKNNDFFIEGVPLQAILDCIIQTKIFATDKKTKKIQISLEWNDIAVISSKDHPETSIVIKNSKGRLVVTVNDASESKQ